MPELLTKKKQAWAGRFKPEHLRGTALNPNVSNQIYYQNKLIKHIRAMTDDVEKQLKKLFATEHAEEYFAQDASIGSQARILTNALTEKFNGIFAGIAKPTAEKVASDADKSSSAALYTSLKDLSGGLSLKTSSLGPDLIDVLNATVTENVNLIKSISQEYLSGIQQATMRAITTGNGLQDLVPYLLKSKEITERRAQLIALDQTRKAFNNLCKGRMQKLGIKKFEWLHTSGSAHPRKLHIQLSGKIFSLDDLPIIEDTGKKVTHGIPGQLPYCRCRMLPVISFDDEE